MHYAPEIKQFNDKIPNHKLICEIKLNRFLNHKQVK